MYNCIQNLICCILNILRSQIMLTFVYNKLISKLQIKRTKGIQQPRCTVKLSKNILGMPGGGPFLDKEPKYCNQRLKNVSRAKKVVFKIVSLKTMLTNTQI